jgi:hypothetical protein
MFETIKKIFGMEVEKSPLSALFTEVNELGRKSTCMPIEIIGLSSRLAESAEGADRQVVIDTLLKDYVAHKNAFVRRAATIAFRRMDDLDNPTVTEAMYQRLSDDNAWVVYDAAWFFEKHQSATGKIVEKLQEIAGEAAKYDLEELQVPYDSVSDADLQARYMAAKALK